MTTILAVDSASASSAIQLLVRFFAEEGFAGDQATIPARFEALRRGPHHWAALAFHENQPVGVVTVNTMLYVEWGRMAEIADLYVLPEQRHRGVARALIHAAIAWSRKHGCSAVEVVMTPQGESRHRLSRFYETLSFAQTGRSICLMHLDDIAG